MFRKYVRLGCVLGCLALLNACTTMSPPKNIHNVCELFEEERDWLPGAQKASERWQVPVPLLMAFMYQESKFVGDAKPPRTRILWVIPGPRPSSAYGYAQASDEAWKDYVQNSGSWFSDRDDFADAIDFMGWYVDRSARQLQIPKQDAYRQYLAYHEGVTGYRKASYKKKPWLLKVAQNVQNKAKSYERQYAKCR